MAVSKNNIKIFKTTDSLFKAAALFILEQAGKAISEKGCFVIALSGGQTPAALFKLLAEPIYDYKLQKDNIFVFWGDERCVPLNDERNNAYQAKKIWLNKVAIPRKNIFRIAVNFPPIEAAKYYQRGLKTFFENKTIRFDMVLLGLGENGHTASIFPGTKLVEEKEAGIRAVYVAEEKMYRISMTAPMINNAEQVLFMATGKNKSSIVQKIIKGAFEPNKYPAQLINPTHGQLNWYIDEGAASQLS